jgi:hypothetical protein
MLYAVWIINIGLYDVSEACSLFLFGEGNGAYSEGSIMKAKVD